MGMGRMHPDTTGSFQPFGVGKWHPGHPGTMSAGIDADQKLPGPVIRIEFLVKSGHYLQGFRVVQIGVERPKSIRQFPVVIKILVKSNNLRGQGVFHFIHDLFSSLLKPINVGLKNASIPMRAIRDPIAIKRILTPKKSAAQPVEINPMTDGIMAKLKYREKTLPINSGLTTS